MSGGKFDRADCAKACATPHNGVTPRQGCREIRGIHRGKRHENSEMSANYAASVGIGTTCALGDSVRRYASPASQAKTILIQNGPELRGVCESPATLRPHFFFPANEASCSDLQVTRTIDFPSQQSGVTSGSELLRLKEPHGQRHGARQPQRVRVARDLLAPRTRCDVSSRTEPLPRRSRTAHLSVRRQKNEDST